MTLFTINYYLLHNGLLAVLDVETLRRSVNTLTLQVVPVITILAVGGNSLDTCYLTIAEAYCEATLADTLSSLEGIGATTINACLHTCETVDEVNLVLDVGIQSDSVAASCTDAQTQLYDAIHSRTLVDW